VIWSFGNNTNTVASVISGSGGLTKAGTGTLTLAGANIYTGLTVVSSGTLQVGNGTQSSKLGSNASDGVNVANGAVLRISSANVISDSGTLSLDAYGLFNGIVNIDAGFTETVGYFKIGGIAQATGTYGGTGSGASNILPTYFTSGTGVLNVTLVPEPSSLGFLAAGILLVRRRRR